MRFALLCDDPLAKPIIDALADHVDGHQLTHAARFTSRTDLLLHGLKNVRYIEHWEDLLIARDIDAVIVGGSDPWIIEGAKQLATSGTPLLFFPQADQGCSFVYELSLIRDDNRVLLWPMFWHRFDAAAIRLKRAINDGELGQVQFLQLERSLSQTSAVTPIAQSQVDNELLSDIEFPRWLMGDYDQVTGLRTAASDEGVLMQSVVLAGRSLPEANWSIKSVEGAGVWKLTVRGEHRIAVLHREDSSSNWIYECGEERVKGVQRQTSRNALAGFVGSALRMNLALDSSVSTEAGGASWGDLVKCFETVDATHRSVKRRRTIELHFEPMSERAIFKTQMTAIGCGLLVATFLLALCYLGIASLLPLPTYVLVGLRALVFGPLVLFLFAQILLPLTRPSSTEQSPIR